MHSHQRTQLIQQAAQRPDVRLLVVGQAAHLLLKEKVRKYQGGESLFCFNLRAGVQLGWQSACLAGTKSWAGSQAQNNRGVVAHVCNPGT